MKELSILFEGIGEVRGHTFKQVNMSNLGYIYEVSDTFGSIWWEVFKRQENTRFDTVSYPKSESFGKWAWSFMSYEKALERFEEFKPVEKS